MRLQRRPPWHDLQELVVCALGLLLVVIAFFSLIRDQQVRFFERRAHGQDETRLYPDLPVVQRRRRHEKIRADRTSS